MITVFRCGLVRVAETAHFAFHINPQLSPAAYVGRTHTKPTWNTSRFTGDAESYRPKLRDYHSVSMTPGLYDALIGWKALYDARCGSVQTQWYVVPALRGNPMFKPDQRLWMVPTARQTNLRQRLQKFYKMADVTIPNAGTHSLRRTAATSFYEATDGDIAAVQDLLGHASPTQTAMYIDLDVRKERLRKHMAGWEW